MDVNGTDAGLRARELFRLRALLALAKERGVDVSMLTGDVIDGMSIGEIQEYIKVVHDLVYAPPPRRA